MKLKASIFLVALIMLSSSLIKADQLYLKNGDILQGEFLRIKGEFYVFKTEQDFILYVPETKVDDLLIDGK